MSKKKRHIKTGATTLTRDYIKKAMQMFAQKSMEAEKEITPLILNESMSVSESLVLIVVKTEELLRKADHKKSHMTESEIIEGVHALMYFWKNGLFIPSEQFPYTIEEAIREMGEKS